MQKAPEMMLDDAREMLNAKITTCVRKVVAEHSNLDHQSSVSKVLDVQSQIQWSSALITNAMQKDNTEIQNAGTKTAHPILSRC